MTDSNAIEVFRFQGRSDVRVVVRDGEPWWVAADVCATLGINNSRMAMARLDADQKRDDVSLTDTIGRPQYPTLINESGLYELVIRSDKPEAKAFRKWITAEVLPTIRKTGSYGPQMTSAELALIAAQNIVNLERKQAEQDQRIAAIEARLTREDYFTIAAYCSKQGIPCPVSVAQVFGRQATRLSRMRGLEICSVPHPLHGSVNTYHKSILAEVCTVQAFPTDQISYLKDN